MLERRDDANLMISYLLIIIMPSYNCIMYIFQSVGINLPLRMLHVYALLLIYLFVILIRYKLPISNLLCYFGILAFYGISYLWTTNDAKVYFYSTDITAILLIFAPIACICTARVKDWKPIFCERRFLITTDLVIVLSFLSKLSLLNETDYMSYSYGLLPLWAMCLMSAYVFGKKIQWIFLILGGLEGIIFGARAPLMWLIVLAFVAWLVMSREDIKKHKLSRIVPTVVLFIGLFIVVQYIIPLLLESSLADASYVLRRFKLSSFLESGTRDQLYISCRKIISEMGFSVNGLFYDRTVLPNGSYSHNIVYEALISLGWIFGLIFLGATLFLIVRTIRKQNTMGIILAAFFCCSLFFRYFLSGSIFDETKFVMFIAAMYSLQASNSTTLKKIRMAEP